MTPRHGPGFGLYLSSVQPRRRRLRLRLNWLPADADPFLGANLWLTYASAVIGAVAVGLLLLAGAGR